MSAEPRLTVLSDNRSSDPSRFHTEHGLSILLDTGEHRVLLDPGRSRSSSADSTFLIQRKGIRRNPPTNWRLLDKDCSTSTRDTVFYTGLCTGDAAYRTLKGVMGDNLNSFSGGMQISLYGSCNRKSPSTYDRPGRQERSSRSCIVPKTCSLRKVFRLIAIRIRIHRLDFLLFHHEFMRFTPSTPRMVNPPYWKVFAKPKNTNHNTPFAAAEMGSAIWAKEMM